MAPVMQNDFLFSVVCYIPNTETILERSLESIRSQTIGFHRVQLILVGTQLSDKNADICQCYARQYPNQVSFLSGFYQSAAEAYNAALKEIKGDFVYFFQATSSVASDLFERCLHVQAGHPCIFLFQPQHQNLENGSKKFHTLVRGYPSKEQPINLETNFQCIPVGVQNLIIPKAFLANQKFQECLKYYSLQDFALRILLYHPNYLYYIPACYLYTTPMEDEIGNLDAFYENWYFEAIERFCLPLLTDAENTLGHIPFFLQFAAYYYIQWPFLCNMNLRNKNILIGDTLSQYQKLLITLFQKIDNTIIINSRGIRSIKINKSLAKVFLGLKYQQKILPTHYAFTKNNAFVCYEEDVLESLKDEMLYIYNLECINDRYELDVAFNDVLDPKRYQLYAEMNGVQYNFKPTVWYSLTKFFGTSAHKRYTFHVSIPLLKNASRQSIAFYISFGNKMTSRLKLAFPSNFSRLAKSPRYSYWYHDHCLTYCKNNTIITLPAKKRFLIKREFLYWLNALYTLGISTGCKLNWIRFCYWITKPFYKNQTIWLIFDKLFKAGDNGEYFYRYACTQQDNIKKYYVANNNSHDYKRLRKKGYHPLKTGSLKHYLIFLNSDIIFSTHASLFYHLFGNMGQYLRGLVHFENVTLQHGLTVQKLALSMNRVHDNLKRYYCASRYEIENLSRPIYGYEGRESETLKLTGVARYDGLINHDQKEILISPTWRMGLVLPRERNDAPPPYNPAFKDSSYFQVYNQLVNDSTLINTAQRYGYRITYLVHPTVSIQIDDFKKNDYVKIIAATSDTNYEKVLTEASLLVTDYSGIQFDFAYMRKPVVYYHHTDIPPHYEEGCFYYDTMAFGEICTNHQEIVSTLVEYMENQCALKPKFKARIDDFFAYDDHDNCKRIYADALEFQREINARKQKK